MQNLVMQRLHVRRDATSWRTRLVLALVLLLGIGIALYPLAARWVSQWNQSNLITGYSDVLSQQSLQERAAALQNAEAYNESLTAGAAFDPFTQAYAREGSPQYQEYLRQLDGVPSGVMARIRIPTISVDLPVYHGTDEDTLLQGIGHLYGTALPVGGAGTRPILTGHSGLASAVMFTFLDRVSVGDEIFIDVYDETLTYVVRDIHVIAPDDTAGLVADPNRELLTLVTCTPIGVNSERLIVNAERVPTPPEQVRVAAQKPEIPKFPWWALWGGLAILLAAGYVTLGGQQRGRHLAMPGDLEAATAVRAAATNHDATRRFADA